MSFYNNETSFDILVLEKIKFNLRRSFSNSIIRDLEITKYKNHLLDSIVYDISGFFTAHRAWTDEKEFVIAETWFQEFKRVYFPNWLKRKFPVKYKRYFTEIKYYTVCPHLEIPTNEYEKEVHLAFLKQRPLIINEEN